jgi:pimeloyl-ACP methyl ester carboxylesterase
MIGRVAAEVALRHPRRVRALVLVDARIRGSELFVFEGLGHAPMEEDPTGQPPWCSLCSHDSNRRADELYRIRGKSRPHWMSRSGKARGIWAWRARVL